MNYEIKAIRPGSVFVNAIRIFIIVGFIAAIYSFFISPYSGIRLAAWWQKILATLLFTGVYAFVVSIVLWLISRIYNAYILEFDPRSLLMYNVTTFLMPALCIFVAKIIAGLLGGFAMLLSSFGPAVLYLITITVAGSFFTTLLILIWHAIFGPSQGVSLELDQNNNDSKAES